MRGDIIIGINENTISKSKDIYNEVKKGETIIVKVLRNGNIFYLNIEPEIVSRLWQRLISIRFHCFISDDGRRLS